MAHAAITIGTGENAQTFSPAGYKAGVALFENRKSGIPVGYSRYFVRNTANVSVRRNRFVLELPKLQTSNAAASDGFVPAPRVQHVDRVTVEFVTSNLSATTDRAALLETLKGLLADAMTEQVVVYQEEV